MLTLAKIERGNVARQQYYEQEVALSRAAYYTGKDGAPESARASEYAEPSGEWMGAAAGQLGLGEVRVELDQLRAMWAGDNPAGGGQLQARETSVSAFDLLFAAPKSVSVAHAMADGEVRAAIADAHTDAVRESIGYLERNAALVRRRDGERIVAEPAGGLMVATFEQHWNRENDPHLHTHAVVANMAPGSDERWTALHGGAIYRHLRTGGHIYQAKLRQALTERLGVEWGPVVKGQAELVGVPSAVVEHFSARRSQILSAMEDELERPGAAGARARSVAQRTTRRAKEHHDPGELVGDARARASELGLDRGRFDRMFGAVHERPRPTRSELATLGTSMAGPHGLTAQTNHFTRCEVIEALAGAHRGGAGGEELEHLADRYLASRHTVALDRDSDATLKGGRYTTPELLAVEERVLERARSGQGAGAAGASEQAVIGAVAACPNISGEQAEMVHAFCGGGDRVMVGVGRAGTGKTFTAAVMRDAYERSGVPVFGTAVAKRAAKGLEAETGIPSRTVASLLGDHARWGTWPEEMRGGVLFIDEIAMVPTRHIDQLMTAAWEMGMDVRGIGDDAQLPEIQAGGTLRALRDELAVPELREVRRQYDPAVIESLEHLRHGETRQWFEGAEQRGHVTATRNPDQLRGLAVEGYLSDVADAGYDHVLLMARTHDMRCDLNSRVREARRAAGELGDRELTVRTLAFADGDRIIATRNDTTLDIENGTQGTITQVREDLGLDVALDDGRQVTVPASYLQAGHVDHGYALTVYKAQGSTVEHAHFIGSEDLYREEGYTGLTRSREETRFYVMASSDEQRLPGFTVADERVDQVLDSMSQSRAKEYATRLAERIQAAQDTPDHELAQQAEPFERLLLDHRHEQRVRDELARHYDQLAEHQQRLEATEQRLADRGGRSRQLTELARTQTLAVEQVQERVEIAQADLAARAPNPDALVDAGAARREQARREQLRIREAAEQAVQDPAPYVRELIGERRDAPDIETWERAAARIEAYHQAYQPQTGQIEAPGPVAPDDQRRDFEMLSDTVTRSRGDQQWARELPSPLRDLTPDLGLDLDLGMDLGPDLGP